MNTKSLLGSATLLLLAACGGGGGSPGTCSASAQTCAAIGAAGSSGGGPVAGSPAGLFHGTTGAGRTASALVLEGGDFWVLYSPVGSATLIAGAQQGHASFANGTFTSVDVRDFSLETGAVSPGSATGTYAPRSSIAATFDFGAAPLTLSARYDSGYDIQGTLAIIAGSYSGTAVVVGAFDNATMTIFPTGAVTGTSQLGCNFSGNIVPHDGVNSYAVTFTFAGGTCSSGFNTMTGVAYRDTATNRIYSATVNPARTDAFIFAGSKL